MAIYYGNDVSTKYSGTTYTWKNMTEYTYTETATTFTINIKVSFLLVGDSSMHLRFSKGNFFAYVWIDDIQRAIFDDSPEHTQYGGVENAWEVISYTATYNKTNYVQTKSVMTECAASNASTWKGISDVITGTIVITIPAVTTGYAKVNGTWKKCAVWVNVNGTWKQPSSGWVKVNGTWKQMNDT